MLLLTLPHLDAATVFFADFRYYISCTFSLALIATFLDTDLALISSCRTNDDFWEIRGVFDCDFDWECESNDAVTILLFDDDYNLVDCIEQRAIFSLTLLLELLALALLFYTADDRYIGLLICFFAYLTLSLDWSASNFFWAALVMTDRMVYWWNFYFPIEIGRLFIFRIWFEF